MPVTCTRSTVSAKSLGIATHASGFAILVSLFLISVRRRDSIARETARLDYSGSGVVIFLVNRGLRPRVEGLIPCLTGESPELFRQGPNFPHVICLYAGSCELTLRASLFCEQLVGLGHSAHRESQGKYHAGTRVTLDSAPSFPA